MMHRPQPQPANGFALVETLIAAAMIAGMLGVVFQVIQTGARQSREVENRRVAILVAQSQMASIGAAQNSSFGETRGISRGVHWRIAIKPYRALGASAVNLEEVTVTTGIPAENKPRDMFILRTIRVAR